MAKSPPSIAVTSTLAMVRTAEARGFGTADLLSRAGLSRDLLEDPDGRLPGPTVLALWDALRERTGDPVLQLAAPASLPFGAYRVVDYLVGASATVGDGVHRFARFFRLIADAVVLTVEQAPDEHLLVLTMADGTPVPPVYVDYIFAALITRMRMKMRPGLVVYRVDLRRAEPAGAAAYRQLFRGSVQFGARADRLRFSHGEWSAPLETADAALACLLEEYARVLTHRMPGPVSPFAAEVQKAIIAVLPDGCSAEAVADELHVSVRTLQRKLVADGTTFREVADSVRSQLAEEYLTDRTMSTAEVAFLLGFGDQSSFNRAFRRWTGESPGRWRRERI